MTTVQEREEESMPSRRETWKEGRDLEEWLCHAAMRGDVVSLRKIMTIDEHILVKVLVGSFKGKNPLHMATSTGETIFVEELLNREKDLANAVDKELGTALHIASSKGHLEIVKVLLKFSPEMCVACDREGYNPLHIAAMKGKVDVLELLLRTNPYAARLMVDRGDNILHLCVKYNQLESLKLLLDKVRDKEFVKSTDINGNNILHLAVFCKRYEIIKHLLEWLTKREEYTCSDWAKKIDMFFETPEMCFDSETEIERGQTEINLRQVIDVNARNGSGWTARDIHSRIAKSEDNIEVYRDIKRVLRESRVKKSNKLFFPFDPYWQKKKKDTLMIVSSLMATMSFQVGINPPGGVWQDTSAGHEAGKAVIAYTKPKAYPYLMYFNTVGFLLSLTTILELIVVLPTQKRAFGFIQAGISWLTIMIMAFAYTFSVIVVSPTEMFKSISDIVIFVTVIVWAVGVTFLRVLPYKVKLVVLGVIGCPLYMICWVLLLPPALLISGIEFLAEKGLCGTKPNESTVQLTGDTASTPNPTAASQNDSTSTV